MPSAIDRQKAAQAVRDFLSALALDPDSERLRGTPQRVADSFAEFFHGVEADAVSLLHGAAEMAGEHGELVALNNIAFNSICEHHLLPFSGECHLVYAPERKVAGLSALARVVATIAARPQMQERLGTEIARAVHEGLAARGVLVLLQAQHGCLSLRGAKQQHSRVVTLATLGTLSAPAERLAALQLLPAVALAAEGINHA